MKTILALLLIGVAFATASPSCSKEDYRRCWESDVMPDDDPFRETEEYLDETCERFSCAFDYKRRCGYPDDSPFIVASFKQFEKTYDAVCEEDSPLRQKYLENVRCFNRKSKRVGEICQIEDFVDENDPQYCRSVEKYLTCTSDAFRSECGEVAGEVYDAMAPLKEFFGC